MNRRVSSSVLRLAFGCALGTAAATGQVPLAKPALAQEASPTVEQPVQELPVARSGAEARRAPPGIPARKPPVPPEAQAQDQQRAPAPSSAQNADPRRPLNIPPNPGLIARPIGPGGRPIPAPSALEPGVPPDLATGPVPEPPTDRPNVPPPEGVQLGTPVVPPAPPGMPPVIAAVPSLPGERPQPAVPPRQGGPAAPAPAPGDVPAGTEFRVVYPDDMAQTLTPADTRLLNGIAARLRQDEVTRLEILGYASGTAETNRESRRLSLERALAVRSYLIDQGVRRTRIDVRALGPTASDGPADRVDLLLVK
jgi:OmpA family